MPSKRDALQQAVYLLSRRDYSRQELIRRLTMARYEPDAIEAALERVSVRGYVNDTAFARKVYEQMKGNGKIGIRAIKFKLAQKGIDETVISKIISEYDFEEEFERALRLVTAKFDEPAAAEQKQKAARFLSTKGFAEATIRKVINQFE